MTNVHITAISQQPIQLIPLNRTDAFHPGALFVAQIVFADPDADCLPPELPQCFVQFMAPEAVTYKDVIALFDELKTELHALLTNNVSLRQRLWFTMGLNTEPKCQHIQTADSETERFHDPVFVLVR